MDKKSSSIWSKLPKPSRLIKEGLVLVWVQLLVLAPNHAQMMKISNNETEKVGTLAQFSEDDILTQSQVSYRALGGFTGVQSYSVLISCIDGKISVLKTIHDPQSQSGKMVNRSKATMDTESYLTFWNSLRRQKVFKINNAPSPNKDILDEFTFHFEAKIGSYAHKFNIYGMSLPHSARYFAVKNLIDRATHMAAFWNQHDALARK